MNGPFTLIAAAATLFSGTLFTMTGVGIYRAALGLAPYAVTFQGLSYDPASEMFSYHPRAIGYTRDDPLPAWWTASLTLVDPSGATVGVCRGSGEGFYFDRTAALEWPMDVLIGPSCPPHLTAGRYRVTVAIDPLDGARPSVKSTIFEVR